LHHQHHAIKGIEMKALRLIPVMLATALLLGTTAKSVTAETIGENLYKQQCAACHAIAKNALGRNGPSLSGIVGKQAGTMDSFRYSAEFKKALDGKKWTTDLLDAWLASPQNIAPGNYMMYKQDDATVRKAIIDYLKTVE
jgi:cytochrome c